MCTQYTHECVQYATIFNVDEHYHRFREGWAPISGYREYTSLLLGVIKIRPLRSYIREKTRRRQKQEREGRGGEEYGGEEADMEGEEQARRGTGIGTGTGTGTGRARHTGSGRGNMGAQQRSRDEREEEEDDDEEEVVSVCVDHTGVAALICETARYVHRSITLFVNRTSILQSKQRSNGSIDTDPAIELGSHPLQYGTVSAVSGELDGGSEDF